MVIGTDIQKYEIARQIHRVLIMHYVEGLKQSEIAERTSLSTAKVNRLIKQGRDLGLVEINIKSPYQLLLDIEDRLIKRTGLREIKVTPTVSENAEIVLQGVGEAAASLLLENLKDGDTIAITGGKGVSAVVEGLNPERTYDIEVVPATGCVQGKHYTDVNHVATLLAEKLGGRSYQIHAPLFAETVEQKEMLMAMKSVDDVLDKARNASIALVGVGSILSDDSSYYDLHPMPKGDQDEIRRVGAVGELLAHLLDEKGTPCDYSLNSKLVALKPQELSNVALTVGIAAGPNKIPPICATLIGNYLNALVVDEATANGILNSLKG